LSIRQGIRQGIAMEVVMKLSRLFLGAFLAVLLCPFVPRAQQPEQHKHDMGEKLGVVNFTVSCNSAAQQQFNRAVALLHSFWYEEAAKGFVEVTKTDPKCGMGYWGIAMSFYHPVWSPPIAAELRNGSAAVQAANVVGARTPREKDYIAAIAAFYQDADRFDHRTRALAYEKAMEQLHLRYPKDDEAAVFYALALLGTALPTDKSYANQKKAGEILNKVLLSEPEHPGVAHYLIHSFDYPALAPMALAAARSYAKIAPSSPHALHMPSHIFTRLGLWQESIESNIASATAAKNYAVKMHPGAASYDQLHAMDYLAYAYLQTAQDGKVKEIVDALYSMNKVDANTVAAAYAFAAIPARYALERRQWSDAAALKVHPADFPWSDFPYAEAMIYFARSLGASRSGDTARASKDIERLIAIQRSLAEAKENYWATQVEIQCRSAAAWLAHAEGKQEEALQLMRSAADLENSTEKHPVTPGAIVPARELLGELLLELREPQQALKEFEASLLVSPNRFNGLYGAARAAELSGDREKARTFYAKLTTLGEHSDGTRPALQAAKVFLASK
jgi:tetratricopeptide (TPR) repeat protein